MVDTPDRRLVCCTDCWCLCGCISIRLKDIAYIGLRDIDAAEQ